MSMSSSAHDTALGAISSEDLQRAYIWSINSAIEDDSESLAGELADGYRSELRQLFTSCLARSAA